MPATDNYSRQQTEPHDPARNAAVVTPSNSADLTYVTRGVYVGTGGNIKVTTAGGQDITFSNVIGGLVLPFAVKRIWATGTTASDMIALW